jgi:hypothetical protein
MKSRAQLGKSPLGRDVNRLVVALNHAPTLVTGSDHGTLSGLDGDDHPQYFHLSQDELITGQVTFNTGSAEAPFILNANNQGQTVIGLDADSVDGFDASATPGANEVVGTDVSGYVNIMRVGIGITPTTLLHVAGTSNPQIIIEYDASKYVELEAQADGDLEIRTVGNIVLKPTGADVRVVGQVSISNAGMVASYPLHVQSVDSPQFRLAHDATNFADLYISSGGNYIMQPTGDIVLDPDGFDVLPNLGYEINLGSLQKKYLTLHAAELWVETLVAQDTITTIGGRILIGPTTTLTADIGTGDTTIYVKHNQMTNGDRVVMESNGKIEFMAITSAPGGVGPYSYTVTRNLDASGSNVWYAGDAVFNTGQDGDGFIDVFSIQGIHGSGTGPTIIGNVRNSATYNDWNEYWAIGNLDGVYGYGADTYGIGLGRYATNYNHLTIDDTNGIRFFSDTNQVVGKWLGTQITLGYEAGFEYVKIDGTNGMTMFTGPTPGYERFRLEPAGTMYLGYVLGKEYVKISSSGIEMFSNDVKTVDLDNLGNMTLGQVATSQGNMHWNNTSKILQFRGGVDGTDVQAYIDTDGTIGAGGGDVKIGSTGIKLNSGTTYAWGSTAINFYRSSFATQFSGITGMYTSGGGGAHGLELRVDSFTGNDPYILMTSTATIADYIRLFSDDYLSLYTPEVVISAPTGGSELRINGSTNVKLTNGLNIDQLGNDDDILALRDSTDVSHSFTDHAEAVTFGHFRKISAGPNGGGLKVYGWNEGTTRAIELVAGVHSDDTTKSSSADGTITVRAGKLSGTAIGAPSANANIFAVKNTGGTRMIVDTNGEIHLPTGKGITNWDEHDDVALLTGLRASIQEMENEFISYAKPILEATGVVTYNEDGVHFVAMKKLQMLAIDTMIQKFASIDDRVERLEKRVLLPKRSLHK